jgi:hypothetical protein
VTWQTFHSSLSKADGAEKWPCASVVLGWGWGVLTNFEKFLCKEKLSACATFWTAASSAGVGIGSTWSVGYF